MSEANKQIVMRYLRYCSQGRAHEAGMLLSPDLDWWVAGSFPSAGHMTKDDLLRTFKSVCNTLSEPLKFEFDYVTAEDDRVAVAAKSIARRPDGSEYRQIYHMLFRLRNGLIIEGRPYLDTLTYAEQVHGAQITYPNTA